MPDVIFAGAASLPIQYGGLVNKTNVQTILENMINEHPEKIVKSLHHKQRTIRLKDEQACVTQTAS